MLEERALSVRGRRSPLPALVFAVVTSLSPSSADAADATAPRLVLVLSIDQLRPERISPALPGGFGRLLREGRSFADAAHDHADTETCPGHAVMLTGMHPGHAGVPANDFVDRNSGRTIYCVEDAARDARVIGAPEAPPAPPPPPATGVTGRSPRLMRVDALGDWMKRRWSKARVFTVSGKDRAAITLGGRRPDAAYWIDRGALAFTTSRYYLGALPSWVSAWHGDSDGQGAFLSRVPERWEHATGAPANGARPDDSAGESTQYGRTSGHAIRGADRRATLERLAFTPWLDTLTLDFARALFDAESLGRDAVPDLLAVSLSATDLIGHLYGPGSQESRDALLRLDADLGAFLEHVEAIVGSEHLLVALTADHGVLELPEWLRETGQSACPLDGGRQPTKKLREALAAALAGALGDPPSDAPWMFDSGFALTVNHALARAKGIDSARVVDSARAFFATQPGVERTWTPDEIVAAAAAGDPVARLHVNSRDAERSGELIVQPRRDCLFSPYPFGTSHGTPWLYDRAVPLLLRGPGVVPGISRGRAAPVDLAPTLARLIGLDPPPGLDGQVLPATD